MTFLLWRRLPRCRLGDRPTVWDLEKLDARRAISQPYQAFLRLSMRGREFPLPLQGSQESRLGLLAFPE